MKKSLYVTLFLCLHGIVVLPQEIKPEKKWRISPLPVVYYSPETRLGFGALISANANLGDSTTSVSYLQSSLIYTINKQYEINNIGRIYTNRNRHIIQYRLYYTFFPEYYYGYETETPEIYEELIDYRRLWVELRKYWKIRKHYYAGVFGRVNHLYNVNYPTNGSFETTAPPGINGYTIFGIAPTIASDKRDNQVYPRTGHFFEVYWMAHPNSLSDFNFGNLRIDWRVYKPLRLLNDDVLAFQLLFNLNEGTVPFRDMADIGGSVITRGYYRGYYRYKNMYALQTEYRFMIQKYIGLAVWVGAASVAEEWNDPFEFSIKPNAGLGLRLRINQKDKLNLRADYGFGRNQSGLYFDAAEAF
jgi:hypothetical protein